MVNPVTGETWTAVRGGGAFLDGRPLRLAEPPPLEMALVATGFGYGRNRRARQAEILRSVLPVVRDIRRAGAASLDLCALATGRVDAYYEQGLQPWDLAAGGLVATEAGAVVTGLRGQPAGRGARGGGGAGARRAAHRPADRPGGRRAGRRLTPTPGGLGSGGEGVLVGDALERLELSEVHLHR